MPGADLRIVHDRTAQPFPEIPEEETIQILPDETPWRVAIVEGGMASGKPSVVIAVETPDGQPARYVILGTSLEILSSVLIAARAAFPRVFDGGPLAVDVDADALALAQVEALVQVTAGLAQSQGVSLHEMAHAVHDQVKAVMEGRGE